MTIPRPAQTIPPRRGSTLARWLSRNGVARFGEAEAVRCGVSCGRENCALPTEVAP